MLLDGKDLMAAAKAALSAAVAVLEEFHRNHAAERQLTCEELSVIAFDLEHAAKILRELFAVLPANAVKFASTSYAAQKILA